MLVGMNNPNDGSAVIESITLEDYLAAFPEVEWEWPEMNRKGYQDGEQQARERGRV